MAGAFVTAALVTAAAARAGTSGRVLVGEPVTFDLSNLSYPPTVSPTLLLVAMTLSGVRPCGRIRPGTERG